VTVGKSRFVCAEKTQLVEEMAHACSLVRDKKIQVSDVFNAATGAVLPMARFCRLSAAGVLLSTASVRSCAHSTTRSMPGN
jgi:hypothetical protein